MSKRTPNPHRPGRGTKGAMNLLLSTQDQGRAYAILGFMVQPEVTLFSEDGKVERRYFPARGHDGGAQQPIAFTINEAQFGDTLPVFMEKLGLKMQQGSGGK